MSKAHFSFWLQTDECAKKLYELTKQHSGSKQILKTLVKDYFLKYGSTHAATDYFEEYFSKADKKELIMNYRTKRQCLEKVWESTLRMMLPTFSRSMNVSEVANALGNKVRVSDEFLPNCYCSTCFVDYGNCIPSYGCRLDDDQEILQINLDKVVKRLVYQYRNVFVHDSRIPVFAAKSSNANANVLDLLGDKMVLHTLDRGFLLEAFRNSLRKFFETASLIAQ
ncbi:MAG: hypothetical protein ABSF09_13325 [Candidatus Bathyarchaeia archaeon]